MQPHIFFIWRRRGDSNSRTRSPQSNDLANRPLKPLGYPSTGAIFGGEGEIRTRGKLPYDGFQDRCLKPLGHLSSSCNKYITTRHILTDRPCLVESLTRNCNGSNPSSSNLVNATNSVTQSCTSSKNVVDYQKCSFRVNLATN